MLAFSAFCYYRHSIVTTLKTEINDRPLKRCSSCICSRKWEHLLTLSDFQRSIMCHREKGSCRLYLKRCHSYKVTLLFRIITYYGLIRSGSYDYMNRTRVSWTKKFDAFLSRRTLTRECSVRLLLRSNGIFLFFFLERRLDLTNTLIRWYMMEETDERERTQRMKTKRDPNVARRLRDVVASRGPFRAGWCTRTMTWSRDR